MAVESTIGESKHAMMTAMSVSPMHSVFIAFPDGLRVHAQRNEISNETLHGVPFYALLLVLGTTHDILIIISQRILLERKKPNREQLMRSIAHFFFSNKMVKIHQRNAGLHIR